MVIDKKKEINLKFVYLIKKVFNFNNEKWLISLKNITLKIFLKNLLVSNIHTPNTISRLWLAIAHEFHALCITCRYLFINTSLNNNNYICLFSITFKIACGITKY